MLDPATASVRLAAVEEFKGRGEAERNRSANLQTLQVGLLVTLEDKNKCSINNRLPAGHVAAIVVEHQFGSA